MPTSENPGLIHEAKGKEAAEAERYLDFFLQSIGAGEDVDRIPPHSKQIMADIPLLVQLDRLPLSPEPPSERDKMVAYFQEHNWYPKQLNEATIASLTGTDETLRRAAAAKTGEPTKALRTAHNNVKRYADDAIRDENILSRVRDVSEDWAIEPDVDKLRADYEALYVLGDILMVREFLNNADWPNSNWHEYKVREAYWRGFMLFSSKYGSDGVLKDAYGDLFAKTQERRRFWADRWRDVNKKVGHLAIEDAVSETESSADTKEDKLRREIADEPREPSTFGDLLPDEVAKEQQELIEKYADQSQKIEGYVQDQGMTYDNAERRVLGGRAIRNHNGLIVGVENKEDLPPSAKRSSRRPKKTRNNLGPNQKNTADGDKRVETDRWLRGEDA